MKPQQLATLLNISPVTLRHWCASEIGRFLSPAARGKDGAKRSFDDQDARILAWVASMKAQNTNLESILITLENAKNENWRDLPELPNVAAPNEPIAVVPREAVEERIRALRTEFELRLEVHNENIANLEKERDGLKDENAQLRNQLFELTRESMDISRKLANLLTRKK
jgi:DNA-binding transcriptional MerR regulator